MGKVRPVSPLPPRRLLPLALLLAFSGACRSQPPDPTTGAQSQRVPPMASSAPITEPPASATASAAADAGPAPSASAAATPAPEPPLTGTQYTKEIQAAFRVAACGGDDAFIPSTIDKKMVDVHCGMLKSGYADYKREWIDVAGPFLAKLRPAGLPTTLVYPFGGGDLVTALATYPDATDITTISLEIAGDIRGITKADNKRLEKELATLRDHLGKLFLKAHSRTINLDIETRGAVPGEAAFTLAAMAIHGFEPITYRYFQFKDDGSLEYLTDDEITKADKAGKQGRGGPFANAEIRFRKVGEDKVRIFRHVAYDLSDPSLKRFPQLIKHLDTKPAKVSTMTKAASHLLWDDSNFGVIRDWLMKHTDWMISDTTGVPPRIAQKYGFEQDVYGQYEWPEPFGTVNNDDAKAFHEKFKGSAPIPFRYGYPDNKSHGHIVVTRKPGVGGISPK
ncbi:MAG: hypothetical protein JST00_15910 [Deltaproteobacteria bacterium]|nr:hypothetical protein [Deltaproteobacteria bacterium]